jgi:uncharacterized protein YceH (UPF0502 family)
MTLRIELSPAEARVVGCLIEKQVTTPDQYPLSLNGLTNACNQKSNRDPVLALGETAVQVLVDALVRKHAVMERSGFGSRVPKYQHCYCNTEFSALKFTPQELAIMCELMLRGPQTAGELRSRAARMAEFGDSAQVERILESLAGRAEGALVQRLPRQPGRREARYAHLLSGELPPELTSELTAQDTPQAAPTGDGRLAQLEMEMRALRSELADLRAAVAKLHAQ